MPTIKLTSESARAIAAPSKATAYYWDDELAGFGLRVGATGTKSFVVTGRVRGKPGAGGRELQRRVVIGRVGEIRPDGHTWTVKLARDEARAILGRMAAGEDPARKPRAAARSKDPTLQDALDTHLARMTKRGRSPRSIETVRGEIAKYLAAWLDRPIAELTGAILVQLHDDIKAQSPARRGRNPANPKGAALANRVIAHVSACWRSLNKKLEGQLGGFNPASAVDRDTLRPKRQRLSTEQMPEWMARVQTMRSPIRRDGLILALYTGLRHEDVRSIRFDDVNFDACTLRLPDPKGGESRAFTIPLSATPLAILERRKKDNLRDLGQRDEGWAFPGLNAKREIGPIDNLRQWDSKTTTRFPAEDVHALRRTWESIAQEEGISELDQHVLSNHTYASHNVNATYIAQHLDHLAKCAAKIEAGITRRLKPAPKRAGHLKSIG